MKKIISLLFVAGVLNTVAAQKITMYSTTASERWTSQKVTVLKHASQTPEVSVYTDSLLQHVTGSRRLCPISVPSMPELFCE